MACRVAICDDSPVDSEYVSGLLNAWAGERGVSVRTVRFSSAESFLFHYAGDKNFDILLLDIEMGTMDGVALARRIRRDNQSVQIIFVTGFAEYMSEGYEVSALHYLIKPVSRERLFAALDRAMAGMRKANRVVLLPVGGEMLRLDADTIHYVEAFSHSVCVVTEKETIEVKLSISEMEKLLTTGFVRCHRSYLVGLKYISRLSKNEVILDSGKALPVSRGAAASVQRAFISYYTGEKHETV